MLLTRDGSTGGRRHTIHSIDIRLDPVIVIGRGQHAAVDTERRVEADSQEGQLGRL